MKIFVSYSFRQETKWVDDYIIPLIRCFGHEPLTGRILEEAAIPDEVRRLIRSARRVLCFITRGKPIYGENDAITGYSPPDWVRDELMLGRGADKIAIEFRENGVDYGGAAHFSAWHVFDRAELPALLLRLAELLKDWPVGPLQLRLRVPPELHDDFDVGVYKGTLRAKCTALDGDGNGVHRRPARAQARRSVRDPVLDQAGSGPGDRDRDRLWPAPAGL